MRHHYALMLVACLARGACFGAETDDASKAYEELFGTQARKVRATRSTEDDGRFAAMLLESAEAVGQRKALQVLLYEKAMEFASRDADAAGTAEQAAKKLLAVAPDRHLEWQEKLLGVYELRYRKADRKTRKEAGRALLDQQAVVADELLADGQVAKARLMYQRALALANSLRSPRRDELLARAKAVTARLADERLAKTLTARLKTHPDDRAAREKLIRLYVVALDAPAKAAAVCSAQVEVVLRHNVLLAARPAKSLSPEEHGTLGSWYEGLAKSAPAHAEAAMLRRAAGHYQAFLAGHPEQDMARLKATLALKRIGKVAAVPKTPDALPKRMELSLGSDVTMTLVLVPAGTFVMGTSRTDTTAVAHAHPAHRVKITRPFYIGATEVTQAQYRAVTGENPSKHVGEKLPVDNVSWEQAIAFCKSASAKTGRRVHLPTEAQWEYACRAGTTTKWCTGDAEAGLSGHAWHKGTSGGKTHPAGETKANAFGLCDMHGNVYEWCHDYYRSGYDPKAGAVDPTGPSRGSERVLRGGSFWMDAGWCRSASRRGFKPTSQWSNVGFRVVVEPAK